MKSLLSVLALVAIALPAPGYSYSGRCRVCSGRSRAPGDGEACGLMFRGASWNGRDAGNGPRRGRCPRWGVSSGTSACETAFKIS